MDRNVDVYFQTQHLHLLLRRFYFLYGGPASCLLVAVVLSELGELQKESVPPRDQQCDQGIEYLVDSCGDRAELCHRICRYNCLNISCHFIVDLDCFEIYFNFTYSILYCVT